jgi:hypothetical protein
VRVWSFPEKILSKFDDSPPIFLFFFNNFSAFIVTVVCFSFELWKTESFDN